MKIGVSLPKELVAWLRQRRKEVGIPISRTIADAIALLRLKIK